MEERGLSGLRGEQLATKGNVRAKVVSRGDGGSVAVAVGLALADASCAAKCRNTR